MCLIAASPQGTLLSDAAIVEAWDNNPDGFGIVFASRGKLTIQKTHRLKGVFALMDQAKGKPYVAHFRFATHGRKNYENTHPFQVSKDLAVAHNGIIRIKCEKPHKSDTWHYVERLKLIPDPLEAIASIATEIGQGNKLAFLHSSGRLALVNEAQGTWEDGIWYSNTYSVADSVFSRWNVNADDFQEYNYCDMCGSEAWLSDQDGLELCDTCEAARRFC